MYVRKKNDAAYFLKKCYAFLENCKLLCNFKLKIHGLINLFINKSSYSKKLRKSLASKKI